MVHIVGSRLIYFGRLGATHASQDWKRRHPRQTVYPVTNVWPSLVAPEEKSQLLSRGLSEARKAREIITVVKAQHTRRRVASFGLTYATLQAAVRCSLTSGLSLQVIAHLLCMLFCRVPPAGYVSSREPLLRVLRQPHGSVTSLAYLQTIPRIRQYLLRQSFSLPAIRVAMSAVCTLYASRFIYAASICKTRWG